MMSRCNIILWLVLVVPRAWEMDISQRWMLRFA